MPKTIVKDNPKVSITRMADAHLTKVVLARKKLGLSVNKASLATEAILLVPLFPPEFKKTIPQPDPVVEKKRPAKVEPVSAVGAL